MEKLVITGITHPGGMELDPGILSIGRNPTNDYRIPDATVSSFHCELVVSEDGITLRDLESTNGTFLEGDRVREAKIQPGQVIQLGSAEVRIDLQEVPDPVEIAIPELHSESPPEQTVMADGKMACLRHPDTPATYKCVNCGNAFCDDCSHSLSISGGERRVFCPSCSGRCENLETGVSRGKKKLSLLGRLTQTIRIRFK